MCAVKNEVRLKRLRREYPPGSDMIGCTTDRVQRFLAPTPLYSHDSTAATVLG